MAKRDLIKSVGHQAALLMKKDRLVSSLVATNFSLFFLVMSLATISPDGQSSLFARYSDVYTATVPYDQYADRLLPQEQLSLDDMSWRVEFFNALNSGEHKEWFQSMSTHEQEEIFVIVTQYYNYEVNEITQAMPWEKVDTQVEKRRLLSQLDQLVSNELQLNYLSSNGISRG